MKELVVSASISSLTTIADTVAVAATDTDTRDTTAPTLTTYTAAIIVTDTGAKCQPTSKRHLHIAL